MEGRGAVSAVKWSKTRSSILAWAGDGGVVVSDVISGEEVDLKPAWKENVTPPKEDEENDTSNQPSVLSSLFSPAPFSSLAFNGKVRNLIAAGDKNGVVHVWRLPQELVGRSQGGEEGELRTP